MIDKTSHTQGPWRVASVRDEFYVFGENTSKAVCHIYKWSSGTDEADATLIAAAPKMAEALKQIAALSDDYWRAAVIARAALGEIEGRP